MIPVMLQQEELRNNFLRADSGAEGMGNQGIDFAEEQRKRSSARRRRTQEIIPNKCHDALRRVWNQTQGKDMNESSVRLA